MKFVWPVLLGFFRTFYLAYSFWCLLFPLALGALAFALLFGHAERYPFLRFLALGLLGAYVVLALFAVAYVYWRRSEGDPNPWQSGFLSWFGTLKLFRNEGGAAAVKLHWWSSYLVENPRGYRISGSNLRAILNVLQPGDILLRGYEGYVDGEFIRRSSLSTGKGFKPGWFTHVALYAGELTDVDRAQVPPAFRNDPGYFSTGTQMVIHSMAKGVHTEDILTFLRCDYLCILRLPAELSLKPGQAADVRTQHHPERVPSVSDKLVDDMLLALNAGKTVPRHQALQAARQSALEKIGEDYDFDCSDTKEFNSFSCAELLYFCLRGALGALQLTPQAHAFYPLVPLLKGFKVLERVTITPDDYHDLIAVGTLQCVWEDGFSKALAAEQSG